MFSVKSDQGSHEPHISDPAKELPSSDSSLIGRSPKPEDVKISPIFTNAALSPSASSSTDWVAMDLPRYPASVPLSDLETADANERTPLLLAAKRALFTSSDSFRPAAAVSSTASASSAIADAIPSSSAAASEPPRLAEILPEEVNKAAKSNILHREELGNDLIRLVYEDGSQWEGKLDRRGLPRTGKGAWYDIHGNRHIGEWKNYSTVGEIRIENKDGTEWIGEMKPLNEYRPPWECCLYNAKGTYYFQHKDGGSITGTWVKFKRHGEFIWVHQDGSKWEGRFERDKLVSGKGKLLREDGSCWQEGTWVNGQLHGLVKLTNDNGTTWVGEFQDGKPWHGCGVYIEPWFPNKVQEGTWLNGQLQGLVKLTNDDRTTWVGEFRDGKPWNGRGVYKSQRSEEGMLRFYTEQGTWVDGVRQSPVQSTPSETRAGSETASSRHSTSRGRGAPSRGRRTSNSATSSGPSAPRVRGTPSPGDEDCSIL